MEKTTGYSWKLEAKDRDRARKRIRDRLIVWRVGLPVLTLQI